MILISDDSVYHSSKHVPRIPRQQTDNNAVLLISTDNKSLFQHKKLDTTWQSHYQSDKRPSHFSSHYYYRCNDLVNKRIVNKKRFFEKVFICNLHSSSNSKSYRVKAESEVPYRMRYKPDVIRLSNGMKQ